VTHQGASIDDTSGLLEGGGETSRAAKFTSFDDLAAKRLALEALIMSWIAAMMLPRVIAVDWTPVPEDRA
jgi:hypothetical protein